MSWSGSIRGALALFALLALEAGAAAQQGPAALLGAYPEHVAEVTATEVAMRDGTRFPISDGISGKTREERLRRPDIDDMFADPYRPGPPPGPPRGGEDPGRARFEPFFDRIYGDCRRGEVAGRLRRCAGCRRAAAALSRSPV